MENKPLFERLGGSAGIEHIVDEVAKRHLANPTIRARFVPFLEPPEKLLQLKVHLARFLELGSGGPQRYSGRDMKSAHRGMNISPAEYVAALDDIMASLTSAGIDDQTRNDVLALAWSLKGEIVET